QKYLSREWAVFIPHEGVFLRWIRRRDDGEVVGVVDESEDQFEQDGSYCEARVRWETGCLLSIRLLFFNIGLQLRCKIVDDLKLKLSQIKWPGYEDSDDLDCGKCRGSKALDVLQRPLSYML